MIISNKYHFIFIHLPKTAGQSVTNALIPHAANRWQRKIRFFINYRIQLKIANQLERRFGFAFDPQPFAAHASASHIISKLGRKRFSEYFSFGFVRNPWDWVHSQYTYARKNPRHVFHSRVVDLGDFGAFCNWYCLEKENVRLQNSYLCDDDGRIIVTKVCKFESINEDFKDVCSEIGISADLPHFNVSNLRKNQNPYTLTTKQMVAERFAADIEIFNYDFPYSD